MLSLIDNETQYFVAESTKTLDIAGSGKSEKDEDDLWLDLAVSVVFLKARAMLMASSAPPCQKLADCANTR